jgi:hypothetical protein
LNSVNLVSSGSNPWRICLYFLDIFGEPDVKGRSRRISGAEMASAVYSTCVSRGEEMTKGMMQIVEFMLKGRDREALIDKAVDWTVEITS